MSPLKLQCRGVPKDELAVVVVTWGGQGGLLVKAINHHNLPDAESDKTAIRLYDEDIRKLFNWLGVYLHTGGR